MEQEPKVRAIIIKLGETEVILLICILIGTGKPASPRYSVLLLNLRVSLRNVEPGESDCRIMTQGLLKQKHMHVMGSLLSSSMICSFVIPSVLDINC